MSVRAEALSPARSACGRCARSRPDVGSGPGDELPGPGSRNRPGNGAHIRTETGVVDASALGFAQLGKTITASGSVIASGPARTWSVRGTLVAVTHQNPILTGGQGFITVLTLALSWPENNLSSVVISPSAEVTIDED